MRIISRIDIKNEFVIKGINLEGLRKIGDPLDIATSYYKDGIDEIMMMDAVASLYGRNNLFNIVERAVKNIFVPITLGGGIKSLNDIDKALRSGADKVAINSYATENPNFIREAVKKFGSSTITVYIEAKNVGDGKWEAYKNSGRDKTGLEIIDWIQKVQDYNCGELLITSIDYEGLQEGFDLELLNKIYPYVNVPLIFNGGCGKIEDILKIKKKYKNISFSIASAFHYKKISIKKLKNEKNLYS
ncbi:imidazole glycerol phosphate synthase cyclase subunit [Candidatus Pelagibacter sp.]|nr:imidazole glycerol phosphate synthase cyclase subunit [Candidatus Pelagibacter sp.]